MGRDFQVTIIAYCDVTFTYENLSQIKEYLKEEYGEYIGTEGYCLRDVNGKFEDPQKVLEAIETQVDFNTFVEKNNFSHHVRVCYSVYYNCPRAYILTNTEYLLGTKGTPLSSFEEQLHEAKEKFKKFGVPDENIRISIAAAIN